jgi:hypothetical protein
MATSRRRLLGLAAAAAPVVWLRRSLASRVLAGLAPSPTSYSGRCQWPFPEGCNEANSERRKPAKAG